VYLIVGLGNPGEKYKHNFHNMGFMAVDEAALILNAKFKKKECQAITAEAFVSGEKIIIAKPQTFMNLSGESVRELIGKYKIPYENLIVIYDDYDLKKGSLRIRAEGSAGTHNGMRNVISELQESKFSRIKVGIKDDFVNIPIINYVLSDYKKEDSELFATVTQNAAKAAITIATGGGIEYAMQKFNSVK